MLKAQAGVELPAGDCMNTNELGRWLLELQVTARQLVIEMALTQRQVLKEKEEVD